MTKLRFGKIFTAFGLASLLSFSVTGFSKSVLADDSGQGIPGKRSAGGTRGENACHVEGQSLMALVPENYDGSTLLESPTLFFYIPQISDSHKPNSSQEVSSSQQVEFVLNDNKDNEVYQTKLSIPKTSGIMGIKIPVNQNSATLKMNQKYTWSFAIICNPDDRTQDFFVEGSIKRISPEDARVSQLDRSNMGKITPFVQAQKYKEVKLWYDVLELLARNISTSNSEVKAKWVDLLTSMGLGNTINREFLVSPSLSAIVINQNETFNN